MTPHALSTVQVVGLDNARKYGRLSLAGLSLGTVHDTSSTRPPAARYGRLGLAGVLLREDLVRMLIT